MRNGLHVLMVVLLAASTSTSTALAGGKEIVANSKSAGRFSEKQTLALLSRELAKSSDQLMGTENKGLCGKSPEELQQLLRAVHAQMDARKLDDKKTDKILKKFKTCDSGCIKSLCKSKTFKKLDSEKETYGSAKDGV